MQDIRLINTFPFFKAGMQSHLSLPPAKEQPNSVSAPGSTRLTSSPDKALRLRDRWSSWILLCNLATTPSDQRCLCTCLHLFSRSRAEHSARSKPSFPASSEHLRGCTVLMGPSMHLHNHLVCLQRLLLCWAWGRQAWMTCAMQNTGAWGSSVVSLSWKMQPNHRVVTGMWNEASRLYKLLPSFFSVLVLLCPNRGQTLHWQSLFSSGCQSLLHVHTTALSVGFRLSQNWNPQYFRAISVLFLFVMNYRFFSWNKTQFSLTLEFSTAAKSSTSAKLLLPGVCNTASSTRWLMWPKWSLRK